MSCAWARAAACASDQRGVVILEVLAALAPLLLVFFSTVQLALLGAAQLVVQDAAAAGARSASVVLDDDPARYTSEAARRGAIEEAVQARLAALGPGAAATAITLVTEGSSATGERVTMHVDYSAPCAVPIARLLVCAVRASDGARVKLLHAEATMPRFAAAYAYPSAAQADAP